MCCTGKGGSASSWNGLLSDVLECHRCGSLVLTGLSSSELLNTKWWHTGLWLLNLCCSAMVAGVVGSKDKSNSWRHGISMVLF